MSKYEINSWPGAPTFKTEEEKQEFIRTTRERIEAYFVAIAKRNAEADRKYFSPEILAEELGDDQ